MRILAFALLLALIPGLPHADAAGRRAGVEDADAASYVEALLARARSRRVAQDKGWLRLGHWRAGWLGGFESEADGPAFFLAENGKTDPAAELESTVRAFFASVPVAPASVTAEHALCRFPARLAVLARALEIDPQRLPAVACPRLEEFWKRLSPVSVSVVFSSYYLNNPASAFGHTFLRIAKTEHGTAGDRYDLIDQGVDYAAAADTSNAIVYAFKGLTGLFRGVFSARPYFYKVREYADYESRDLWEYELDLTPAEVAMLVAHIWELGQTWFDYYYMTENCSYHILGALEAAAPRLELLGHVGKVTLPADSIKALFANPGLVRGVRFRPSARTQLAARAAHLTDAELDEVVALAEGGEPRSFDEEPLARRVRELDAALDLFDVRHGRAIIDGTDPAADALRQVLLERRSATGVIGEPLVVQPPSAGGPERGHGSMRVGVGAGASTRDGPLVAVDARVALHDLIDPPAGFSNHTQLEFLKARLLYATGEHALRLDDASLVEATSLNGFDRLEQRLSWKMRVGATRLMDAGCPECVVGRAEVGAGPALLARDGAIAIALTADTELLGAPGLHGSAGSFLRPGIGPGLLVRFLAADRAALLGTASWRWLPDASPTTTFQFGMSGRVHLNVFSLGAEWRRTPLDNEVLMSLSVYGR